MSETKTPYCTSKQADFPSGIRHPMLHIGMVGDLAQRLGISKHEVLQQAIELFFEVKNDSDKPTQA